MAPWGFAGEWHDPTGLVYLRARWYNGSLGRFAQVDPFRGSLPSPASQHSYTYGNSSPVRYSDPAGQRPCSGVDELGRCIPAPLPAPAAPVAGDPASPWQTGIEWLTGLGPRHHEFREGDPFTELLQTHKHIEEVRATIADRLRSGDCGPYRDDYDLSGLQGVPKYLQDYSNVLALGHTGNLAVTFLGSYELAYYVTNVDRSSGTAEVTFEVRNVSNLASATHPPVLGYTDLWQRYVEPYVNNLVANGGPMSPVTQSFRWTETIHF